MLDEATQMQNSISWNIRIFIQHSSNIRTKMLDDMLDAFAPALRLKTHYFHSKLLCQKPILRQIEWLQHVPITKSGALPLF